MTTDDHIIYYDRGRRLIIEVVSPMKVSRLLEDPLAEDESVVDAVKEIGWKLGWKYRRANLEIEALT